MELYGRVRHAVLVDGVRRQEAARIFAINRRTVEKMLRFSILPDYRRVQCHLRRYRNCSCCRPEAIFVRFEAPGFVSEKFRSRLC